MTRSESYSKLGGIIAALHDARVRKQASALLLEPYTCHQIEFASDPIVPSAYRFMRRHFGDEAETQKWFAHTIEKKLNQYFFVADRKNKIVAFSNSQYIKLQKENRSDPIQTAVGVW